MKPSILLLPLLLCCWHCNKKDDGGDLSGKSHIRGRLFLYDKLTQNANGQPLGSKKITLRYANTTDTLNYLFSTTTEADGYFVFSNLKEGTPYRLYYEETDKGVLYSGSAISTAPNDTLRLIAQVATTGQNGLHLTITDENGIPLEGASVCVFNSPLTSGYTNSDCVGNTFSLPPSDVAGHTFKFSIPLGTYYLSSSLDLNGIQLMAKDTFLVPANEIVFHTIRLKTPNGMKFTVLDPLGIPVAGANFCVFNSPLVSGYANNTCVGSIFSLPASDVSGHTAKYAIPPGTYYINSSLALGDIPLTAQNTVVVPTGQIVSDIIHLKSPNGMKFTVLDPLGIPVAGANFCVFNSPLVSGYANNTCVGSIFSLPASDVSGHTAKYVIPAGTYYINSSLALGDIPLTAQKTVVVPTDQIVSDIIQLKSPNGMKFTVLDSLGGRLAEATLCVFTSLILYQQDTCAGSNFQLTSSINGEASSYNLPPQRYYIYCTYEAGNSMWVGRDTIDLNTDIVSRTLHLLKK